MKASHWFGKIKFDKARLDKARFGKAIGSYLTPRAVLFCFAVLSFSFGALAVASAQSGRMSPYQGEQDGVSAGGNWLEFDSTDKMTGEKKVRFELQSNNYFKEDPNYKPRVNLDLHQRKAEARRLQSRSPAPSAQPPRMVGTASAGSRGARRRYPQLQGMELAARPLPLHG